MLMRQGLQCHAIGRSTADGRRTTYHHAANAMRYFVSIGIRQVFKPHGQNTLIDHLESAIAPAQCLNLVVSRLVTHVLVCP